MFPLESIVIIVLLLSLKFHRPIEDGRDVKSGQGGVKFEEYRAIDEKRKS